MTMATVFQDRSQIICGDVLETLRAMGPKSVDLVFGSPPYAEKGQRYIGKRSRWPSAEWVKWMAGVTWESVRVCRGDVLWVVNGSVKGGRYLPAVEGLIWEVAKYVGIRVERPAIWHKNAPPNRKDWFSNDWEYIVCFRRDEPRSYFDWEAVATAPKFKSGGRFRQRTSNGNRRLGNKYPKNKLARPRDVLRVTVGGGHLGSDLAHENEAPFPEGLPRYFVPVLCPPDGIVLDPFSGSGTTGKVALSLGRKYVGIDHRESQVELTARRLKEAEQQGQVEGATV